MWEIKRIMKDSINLSQKSSVILSMSCEIKVMQRKECKFGSFILKLLPIPLQTSKYILQCKLEKYLEKMLCNPLTFLMKTGVIHTVGSQNKFFPSKWVLFHYLFFPLCLRQEKWRIYMKVYLEPHHIKKFRKKNQAVRYK